jgi:hypothetical protein
LQELAGHSTPTLTARYSHRRLYDLAGAVEKLPAFLPGQGTSTEAQALRATGTDGKSSPQQIPEASGAYTPLTQTPDSGCEGLRLADGREGETEPLSSGRNPLSSKGVETERERLMPPERRAGDGARTHDSHVGNLAPQPIAWPGNRSPSSSYEKPDGLQAQLDACEELQGISVSSVGISVVLRSRSRPRPTICLAAGAAWRAVREYFSWLQQSVRARPVATAGLHNEKAVRMFFGTSSGQKFDPNASRSCTHRQGRTE